MCPKPPRTASTALVLRDDEEKGAYTRDPLASPFAEHLTRVGPRSKPLLPHSPQRGSLPRPSGYCPGSTGSGHRIVRGASRMRMIRAGTPPTTAFAGTFLVTTALAPTIELSPTCTPRRMQAL